MVQPKLRRSRSAMDVREPARAGVKRFQPTLETIPNKRLKPAGSSQAGPSRPTNTRTQEMKPIPIRAHEKKTTAIAATMKSTISNNALVTAVKKAPISKTTSGPTTSKFVSKVPPKAAVAVKATAKTMARPAPYDYKARFTLLTEKFNQLKEKNDHDKEQLATLEEQNEALELNEKELLSKLEAAEQELFNANETTAQLKEEILALEQTNANLVTKNTALANSLTMTSEELCDVKAKCEKLEEDSRAHVELKRRFDQVEKDLGNASDQLIKSQHQLYAINAERMVLHNMVLDLRGNIRVFARVRPPLIAESDKALCGWSFVDEASLEIVSNEPSAGGRKQLKHDFAFDHVFDPNTSQEEIFEMVSPLIQSALDGYNVCIFAYGKIFLNSFLIALIIFHPFRTNWKWQDLHNGWSRKSFGHHPENRQVAV